MGWKATLVAAVACAMIASAQTALANHLPSPVIRVHPIMRHTIEERLAYVENARPNTAYAGTVTTLPNFQEQVEGITYDSTTGDFAALEGAYLYDVTLAGQNTQLASLLSYGIPNAVVWDPNSQLYYISMPTLYEILSVTPTGTVSVFAGGTRGTGDGKGAGAQFQQPTGLALDPVNHWIYVADFDRVRRVDESGDVVTVGPPALMSPFFDQSGNFSIAFDTTDVKVAVADPSQDRIHLFDPVTQTYTILAGSCLELIDVNPGCISLHANGQGSRGLFAGLSGIAYDAVAGAFYLGDQLNGEIRKVSLSGNVSTLAGGSLPGPIDGVGLAADFLGPSCTVDYPVTDTIFVCDSYLLRTVTTQGSPAPLPSNALSLIQTPSISSGPDGMARASDGTLWFPETNAYTMGRVLTTGTIHEYALPGGYGLPYGAASDSLGQVWFGDYNGIQQNNTPSAAFIGKITSTGSIVEFPLINFCGSGFSTASLFAPDDSGGVWFADSCPLALGHMDSHGTVSQVPTSNLTGIALDSGVIWVGEANQLQEFSASEQLIATFMGIPADSGIAVGPGGLIWFLSNSNESVGSFNPSNAETVIYQLPTCGCSRNLADLTPGTNDDVWFTEGPRPYPGTYYPGGLGHVTASGRYTEHFSYDGDRHQQYGKSVVRRFWSEQGRLRPLTTSAARPMTSTSSSSRYSTRIG
jgi:streptogramin lyase